MLKLGSSSILALLVAVLATQPVAGAGLAIPIFHGPRDKPVVALTFDDCWSPERAERIRLKLLEQRVKATLFCTAEHVADNPAVFRMFFADGHEFANHTKFHPNLTGLSRDAIRREICGARAMIDTNLRAVSTNWFRPPYGAYNDRVRDVARDCGYTHMVLWDVDSRDWSGISSEQIAQRALAGGKGSIVLMHIGPANTPVALGKIIQGYRQRGFDFVKMSALIARL